MRHALITFLAIPLLGQGMKAVAKHEPVMVEGIATDQRGNPIEGARVDHAIGTPSPVGPTTDPQGRFSIDAEGPAVVIRKPGFESYFPTNRWNEPGASCNEGV